MFAHRDVLPLTASLGRRARWPPIEEDAMVTPLDQLTDEQNDLVDRTRRLAHEHLRPKAAIWDEHGAAARQAGHAHGSDRGAEGAVGVVGVALDQRPG